MRLRIGKIHVNMFIGSEIEYLTARVDLLRKEASVKESAFRSNSYTEAISTCSQIGCTEVGIAVGSRFYSEDFVSVENGSLCETHLRDFLSIEGRRFEPKQVMDADAYGRVLAGIHFVREVVAEGVFPRLEKLKAGGS